MHPVCRVCRKGEEGQSPEANCTKRDRCHRWREGPQKKKKILQDAFNDVAETGAGMRKVRSFRWVGGIEGWRAWGLGPPFGRGRQTPPRITRAIWFIFLSPRRYQRRWRRRWKRGSWRGLIPRLIMNNCYLLSCSNGNISRLVKQF